MEIGQSNASICDLLEVWRADFSAKRRDIAVPYGSQVSHNSMNIGPVRTQIICDNDKEVGTFGGRFGAHSCSS